MVQTTATATVCIHQRRKTRGTAKLTDNCKQALRGNSIVASVIQSTTTISVLLTFHHNIHWNDFWPWWWSMSCTFLLNHFWEMPYGICSIKLWPIMSDKLDHCKKFKFFLNKQILHFYLTYPLHRGKIMLYAMCMIYTQKSLINPISWKVLSRISGREDILFYWALWERQEEEEGFCVLFLGVFFSSMITFCICHSDTVSLLFV